MALPVNDFFVPTTRVGCFVPPGPVRVVAGVLLILRGCAVFLLFSVFVFFALFFLFFGKKSPVALLVLEQVILRVPNVFRLI
jgi:hypothetical protein